jgi:hypothetical protein
MSCAPSEIPIENDNCSRADGNANCYTAPASASFTVGPEPAIHSADNRLLARVAAILQRTLLLFRQLRIFHLRNRLISKHAAINTTAIMAQPTKPAINRHGVKGSVSQSIIFLPL